MARTLLLALVAALAAAAPAAGATYPDCPSSIAGYPNTETSERGSETNPSVICWYKKPNESVYHTIGAGWYTPAHPGAGTYGCGLRADDDSIFFSRTHYAYATQDDPQYRVAGFEEAAKAFLKTVEGSYAKPCVAKEPEPEPGSERATDGELQLRVENDERRPNEHPLHLLILVSAPSYCLAFHVDHGSFHRLTGPVRSARPDARGLPRGGRWYVVCDLEDWKGSYEGPSVRITRDARVRVFLLSRNGEKILDRVKRPIGHKVIPKPTKKEFEFRVSIGAVTGPDSSPRRTDDPAYSTSRVVGGGKFTLAKDARNGQVSRASGTIGIQHVYAERTEVIQMRVRTGGSYEGTRVYGMTVVVTSSTAPDIPVGTVGVVSFDAAANKRFRISLGPHSDDFAGPGGVDVKIYRPR